MKRFIFFLTFVSLSTFVYPQSNSNQIDKAEELIKTGFPKDAAVLLEKEFPDLSCDKQAPLYVKAHILYITALSQFEEDAAKLSINHLNEYLSECSEPAKQIFHSYLGELYLRLGNRSARFETNDIKSTNSDLSTWSKKQFEEKALHHFWASMKNSQELFQIPIADYNLIMDGGKNSETYRPTLYDVITHRFLDNWNEKPSLSQYPDLIAPMPDFLKISWTKDSSGFDLTMNVFRNLLRFHAKDANPTALIQSDLDRLAFFTNENTNDKCVPAWDYLLSTYSDHPSVTLAAFAKAKTWSGTNSYNSRMSEKERYFRAEAAKICRTYSQKFPDSDGGNNCATLLKEIEKQEINALQMESVLVPGKPALAYLKFRNITHLTCRIYQVSLAEVGLASKNGYNDFLKDYTRKNKPLKEWDVQIPDTKDYLFHGVEFEIPALDKTGIYLLLATSDTSFSVDKSLFAAQGFQVSSLFPVYMQSSANNVFFIVANRITGEPLENVSIQVFNPRNPTAILETLKTAKDGTAQFSKYYEGGLSAVFSLNKDSLYSQDYIWNPKPYNDQRTNYLSISIFTDRAVYRPGQTVYFKGVLTEVSETKVIPAVSRHLAVSIRDVNRKEISNQTYTSNDFGGFDGSFSIPVGVLTGNMTIETPYGSVNFRVEEYKRPRFEVTFDKLKDAYQLNEEVKITGKAMMLNGLPLENATVNYQVKRYVFRPLYYYKYIDNYAQIIKTGTATTKSDGTFEIPFKTLAGQDDKTGNFYYTFGITADVTDITGEMQSGNVSINAGTNSVRIRLNVPKLAMGKENDKVDILFQNFNGENIPVSATITIDELKQPKTPYIQREWEMPDIKIIPKEEFLKKFPQYAYENDSLSVLKQVYTEKIENASKDTLLLSEILKKSGSYRITVFTIDKSGTKIEEVSDFNFLKENEKAFPIAENALFEINKTQVNIGDTVKIIMGSAVKGAKAFYMLINNANILKRTWIETGQKINVLEIPVDSSMMPLLTINLQLIQNSKMYGLQKQISVVDPGKELKIEVSGIRDKTLPGAKERWEVKITGKDGNPVNAALFATMYDAALDKFADLSWNFSARPNYRYAYLSTQLLGQHFYSVTNSYNNFSGGFYKWPAYSTFNWFGYSFYMQGRGSKMYKMLANSPSVSANDKVLAESAALGVIVSDSAFDLNAKPETESESIRQNFSETAFFYPDLRTDKEGNIILQFTLPDALTRWNMKAIGYTPTLQIGNYEHSIVTESDFMVMPNLPRFMRVGDTCFLTARIANKTDKILSGVAKIVLEDMVTGKVLMGNIIGGTDIPFNIKGNESITVSWKYRQPANAEALMIRISASSGNFTDGEEHIIPVLPSEAILLESIPIEITKAGTHTFSFENLSTGNKAQRLTVEMSTSPVWYAIQALPVLSSYPYESADQLFNTYYAAALGRHIVSGMPQIEKVFKQWRNFESDAFLSNLEKNQELKTVLLSETPWVMDAQNEQARKQRLATLFDVNNLQYSQSQAISKLQQQQLSNGGFSWFPNMPASEFITRYIVTGIGKLKALGLSSDELQAIAQKAVRYLDQEWQRNYEESTKKGGKYISSSYDIFYLYARSFFKDIKLDGKQSKTLEAVLSECIKKQTEFDFNTRAMLVLASHRNNYSADAQKIAKSIDNYSIGNASTGKYWRTQQGNATVSDIALSSLMVEVYNEVLKNKTASNDVLTWLLRNKRTNDWKSPMATADAVYALISSSETILNIVQVSMKIGHTNISPEGQEAGTGYYKVVYNKNEIEPDMKTITVVTPQDRQIWGGAYLQYQTSLDKVKGDKDAPLSVEREIFVKNGEQWTKLQEGAKLQVGDKITVRLTIKANRDFEYVHVRDLRAAAFEPVEQTSGYAWKTLGYYRSVRDAFVDLFFNRIPRGTWTVDYELFVTQNGAFSNGYSSVQCLYAPEFSGTGNGMRVGVGE